MGNNDGGGFVLGLFVGGAAGFLAGILMAPRSGEETRAILAEKGSEWRERAGEISAVTRERLGQAVTEGQTAARRARGHEGPEFDDEFDIDFDDDPLTEPDDDRA
ncbi:MAG: YtxH domain-containing protein [Chloroflexi bacterium]|jgi:gas vesicle protein|nr:YtxH domain-containing protein [Chloroflexota bacterium]MBT4074729.1 YtxH domain-containing protein [Chloroflexota bacterium]MBT4514434.1 YtxH domain-containing protein [Chloroflexota bacterium]MBT5318782.1 YtxH domain-containing protein [Chloroflexota bacterium]MBT6682078.1 YtxH domain-containing protein [Chloroflexota bacterium]